MNHKELLKLLTPTITYSPWARIKNPNKVMKALRAVVELHKPEPDYWNAGGVFCRQCGSDDIETAYPCPTIQAIEKELK